MSPEGADTPFPTVSTFVSGSALTEAGASLSLAPLCGVSVNSNSLPASGRLYDLRAPSVTEVAVGLVYSLTKAGITCPSSRLLPSAFVYTTDLTSRSLVPSFLSTDTTALYRVSSYVMLGSKSASPTAGFNSPI